MKRSFSHRGRPDIQAGSALVFGLLVVLLGASPYYIHAQQATPAPHTSKSPSARANKHSQTPPQQLSSPGTSQPSAATSQGNAGALQGSPGSDPNATAANAAASAPSARPFLHLVGVLIFGVVFAAARLAARFRRFLHLGVFSNWYAALYLMLGAALSAFPIISQHALEAPLGSQWKAFAPWITDGFGIFATVLLPLIQVRAGRGSSSGQSVPGLSEGISTNPIFAVIETGIFDHLSIPMQRRITAFSSKYTWQDIKIAVPRVLEQEVIFGRVKRSDAETVLKLLDKTKPDPDPGADTQNKYKLLIRVLETVSFSRLETTLVISSAGDRA